MEDRKTKLERFEESVLSKYQIYNSIFMTLPFSGVSNVGRFLPLFGEECKKGYQDNKTPTEIVEEFFKKYAPQSSEKETNDLLFRFIQYIERQVVLFDAIEDAAFSTVNNMDGLGSIRNMKEKAEARNKVTELKATLQKLKVRPVLTAHPTQFYPDSVLVIINDLTQAIKDNDLTTIKKLLAQLGKTPFYKKEKPSPLDEAIGLIWYLENVFYHSMGNIYSYLKKHILKDEALKNPVVELGFWPGGDRDGNPFVKPETTLKVAERLKKSILKNYYKDIRVLKRRLTFKGVEHLVKNLEDQLYKAAFLEEENTLTLQEFRQSLEEIRAILISEHQSLFVDELDALLYKVDIFGFYFASLDIRQDSRIHRIVIEDIAKSTSGKIIPENYSSLSCEEQIQVLSQVNGVLDLTSFNQEITKDTLGSILMMMAIQKENGEKGCNRYIISNNQNAANVLEVYTLLKLCGWQNPTVDIVPLFETIDDLDNAEEVMTTLYQNKDYKEHLKSRGYQQTIMLGFSDGTKDGGYLKANWSIYTAKERLTKISREYGIEVLFFDGRGGPPARGGGKSHQFYASFGKDIESDAIQITIQGQTISSNFGTLDSSQYNLEQLISAGVNNKIFTSEQASISSEEKEILQDLADISYQKYTEFKNHPKFIPYLEKMSTLKYYAKANIGSRPSKRGNSDTLNFSDLRAIPFVGSWSQLKQNVPGFYGVGTALAHYDANGNFEKLKALYKKSLFFRTLLENSMMSLTKSFFKLTEYMKDDVEFGAFWQEIYQEYQLSKEMLLKLTEFKSLMEDHPAGKASIQMREEMVLPLLTIQQYALKKVQDGSPLSEVYENMVVRSLFGNINASRNSA
ncbi:phosphoenolpyruvate carboxylase [Riemerella anatipestifer]|uniref:Phosphoenolpyruvate carboxylase n=4 Tax=Riemerella anatipestifer TaxID=34085 RepID=E4T920_RIEAD|nr:phosphoenolpyruvate carboxylase [Riemerella anatipestifer]ADQ81501.1 Phosphoenolpyruvate carboxylase [Riemerella anatipestifer ATCC 11845 = DSM 15868]AFD55518.1 phosphoenolpyruvate carboxylase [Riemerella anatipestifer ATCC 11845 = DSM 15868]MBT0552420.1 phosphoenolpyruvate carboxylase [Riemerella anatipestifer]MBT0554707.1 phosphoenolpyruvate carboxylase [Riemerella anatipestifer]MBT0561638.1 phosphoenolpyruvate carboxylase [Riemerella anatipestifer]